MADDTITARRLEDEEFADLRAARARLETDPLLQIQAVLEEDPDKVYSYNITIRDKRYPLRFRRWRKNEANALYSLPFLWKLHKNVNIPLTAEEENHYLAAKIEMIRSALIDKDAWRDWLFDSATNRKVIEVLYKVISLASMESPSFHQRMTDFFASDYGRNYGYYWFKLMGKTPSEIGKLPASDYNAFTIWISKWGEKV